MNLHKHEGHDCGGHLATPSVHQTLDEMEFERGIWSAALNGENDIVQKQLDRGVNPNCVDKSGYSALHYASRNNHLEVCKTLLNSGADSNCMTTSGKVTPLQRAAYKGNLEIVKLLLRFKADPRLQDSDGKTALHKAIENKKTEVAKVLLDSCPECETIVDNKNNRPADYISHDNSLLANLFYR